MADADKKLSPQEQFVKYNPYAAALEATKDAAERQVQATMAMAYETSRVRAEIRFSGSRNGN